MNKLQRKVDHIQKQVPVKLIVRQRTGPKVKVSLKGLLKGERFSEQEIERAKASVSAARLK